VGATFFLPYVADQNLAEARTMTSRHRTTAIWQEVGWGALALAVMMAAVLFVYLHA
jgi:hypothetical protein